MHVGRVAGVTGVSRRVIVIAVVALALLAAGGYAVWGRDGGGDPPKTAPRSAPELRKAWQRADGQGTQNLPLERWQAGPAFVERHKGVVRALDPRTGEPRWELEPPEGAGSVCAMSRSVNKSGVGAVLFSVTSTDGGEKWTACSYAAAVDAGTGAVLWSERLDPVHAPQPEQAALGAGDRVFTFNTARGPVRFEADGGERLAALWPKDERCRVETRFSTISARYAELDMSCTPGKPGRSRMYDTETGRMLWDTGDDRGTLIADDPLTMWQWKTDGADGGHLQTYDDSGNPLKRVEGQHGKGHLMGAESPVHVSDGVAALRYGQGQIIGLGVGLAVIDLRTGEWLWTDQGTGKRPAAFPIGIEGDRVLGLAKGRGSEGQYDFFSFGLRDGEVRAEGRITRPAKAIKDVDVSFVDAVWDKDMLYLRDATGDRSEPGTLLRAYRRP